MLKNKIAGFIKEMEKSIPPHLRMFSAMIIPQALRALEEKTDEELILLIRKLDEWVAQKASELEDAYAEDIACKN